MDLVDLRERMAARKAELEGRATDRPVDNPPMAASAESPGILTRIGDTLFPANHP